jgi:hypothetical protein
MRIKAERFELPVPFCWSIAQSLDANAARQTTFDCCSDEIWCEKGKRNGHVDLTRAAFLTCCDLLDIGY